MKNILIIGNGGRESAFAWKIKQSNFCKDLFIIAGNAGTAQIAQNIDISPNDFQKIGEFCQEKNITLILVGPEAPLVEGIANFFEKNFSEISLVGPKKEAAQLEGSKEFAKEFMMRHQIPTAKYKSFTKENLPEALKYIENHSLPIVLKADGLAAGKGVVICNEKEEAKSLLKEMIENKKFGDASEKVVIEEFLSGIELSVFVITDGKDYKILSNAKDYKRIGEGDKGLNTGGMGAISPAPFADDTFMKKVVEKVIEPTMQGLQKDILDYNGFIFFGLMNMRGEPFVIEYNVRMGDPESEVIMPRIESDFVKLLEATAVGKLKDFDLKISNQTATTVMLVSGGYPEAYEKGKKITGLEELENVIAFQAGTKLNDKQETVTNGGRVIAITALGNDLEEALSKSYAGAELVLFEKKYYRKDIGFEFK